MSDATRKTDVLNAHLIEKKISVYKLAQMIGWRPNNMYPIVNGEKDITPSVAAMIADALEMQVRDLFPDLIVSEPELVDLTKGEISPMPIAGAEERKTGEELGIDNSKRKLTINDMIVGCQAALPEDGITLSFRKAMNCDGAEYTGYTLSDGERITVKTGVSSKTLDLRKTMIRAKDNMVLKHEIEVTPFGFSRDGELCIILRGFGKPHLLAKGQPLAELVFLN